MVAQFLRDLVFIILFILCYADHLGSAGFSGYVVFSPCARTARRASFSM